jgi:hypothetical protein
MYNLAEEEIGVEFKQATSRDKDQIVLSPSQGNAPKMTVLYRTLPRYTIVVQSKYGQAVDTDKKMVQVDKGLRPDLRIGRSDLGIRKVGEVVDWFAEWVGGEGTTLS